MTKYRKKTFESSYKGLPILTDKEKNLGCYEDMLDILKQQFDEALEKQTRTFIVRYDVRFPSNHQCHSSSDNKLISEFSRLYESITQRRLQTAVFHDQRTKSGKTPASSWNPVIGRQKGSLY